MSSSIIDTFESTENGAKPQYRDYYWCRIHLWFRLMGGLQAKSMTSQRYRAVTRWRICVTMATLWQQQDGGFALLWKRYDNNKMVAMRYYDILHLQQYSHRLNLFYVFFLGLCVQVMKLSVVFYASFVKHPVHCQLYWAILLCDGIPDGKNWVNCAVLTDNSAGLRIVVSSRLSHTELRSSLS